MSVQKADLSAMDRPMLQVLDNAIDPNTKPLLGDSKIMHRPCFAHVEVNLQENQKVVGDGGAMMWMDGDMLMETGCNNGCCTAFWRSCAGESCCQNTFSGPGAVAFGFDLPGDVSVVLLPFSQVLIFLLYSLLCTFIFLHHRTTSAGSTLYFCCSFLFFFN